MQEQASCQAGDFFGLPVWWKYLEVQPPDCIVSLDLVNNPNDLWAIVVVGVEILLRIAGFVAVIAIIISGIKYMTAQGNPEKAAAARKNLYNALAGMLIAMIAASLVSFIGNRLN